jgi:nucleoside-diphosphate-sugar epimerase
VIQNNIQGFENIIRLSYEYGADKFLFASSSSVLGDGGNVPKSTYGVTKATNELQAKMYSQFFPEMNITGLRLYTVYGERMRPDLAIAKFTDAILNNGNITVNGDGGILRDFTYIGDVTDAFKVVIESDVKDSGKTYDIGNGAPISIMELINIMKRVYNKSDFNNITYKEENIHDVQVTNSKGGKQMEETFGFKCKVGIEEGLEKYKEFIEK